MHVSLGEEGGPPVGPSVAHAVWFDPLARPAVTSVHLVHVSTTCPDGWTVDDTGVLTICTPTTTGRARLLSEAEAEEDPTPVTVESLAAPFASTTDVSLIEVGGSNYAPTNTAGEEVALRCLFTPVDWVQAEEAYWFALGIHPANCPGTPWRCTEPHGHAVLRPGPTEPSLRVPLAPAPLADAPALHPGVVTTATFVAPSRVRCESPGGFSPEGDDTVDLDPPFLGEARLRVAAAAGGPLWSDDSRFVTVFDASMAAELTSVDPTFGDRLAPIVLLARGRNLAPTPGLACLFTSGRGAGTVVAAATFVSSRLVKCAAPVADAAAAADPTSSAIGMVGEGVALRLTHSRR